MGRVLAMLLLLAAGCVEASPLPVALHDCHDGDTCRFLLPARALPPTVEAVRLLGVDTPELPGRCPAEQAAALAARDFLLDLLRRAERIEILPAGRDHFGRLLARVLADGADAGAALIAAGLARPYAGGRRKPWCDA